jgi:hypothetical protein
MTTSYDSQVFDSYVPVYDTVPEKWEEARPFFVEQLKKISNAVNIREIGWFLDEELLAGQQFIPSQNLTGTSEQFRSIFRKVIDFGALPAAGTKSLPHGIGVDSNFTLMNMYLSATDPTGLTGFSLQYWAKNNGGDIILNYDATNVNVKVASSYSNFTRSYVVMEYITEL